MIESGANHTKVLDNILQAANKHPNSRVSKLIHSVEEERSQKNIVLLLIELAEHPEYSTDFGISLRYYLDLFEQLGIGRDIVLNEAGLMLLNSSKVYARRVDFVQELVERQILTLSNTEKEMVDNSRTENLSKSSIEKPKRSRKRLVEAVDDPYEVELVPRKFRKLTEEKRFGGSSSQEKAKTTASKFYKIESEQYLHPAAWVHTSIVDIENEEDIDSKRNYKLFTYHVEHRYNTLVPDINFRLHFKVKDYIDEEEERLAEVEDHNIDSINNLADWPPLSQEYIEKYLDLENKVLAIGEILRNRKWPRLDGTLTDHNYKVASLKEVQTTKSPNESNIECIRELSESFIESDSIQLDSGIDNSLSLNNTSANDVSTKSNESELLENTIRSDVDLSITNLTLPMSSMNLSQNLNSTEKSMLECTNESENTIDASNISPQNELTEPNVTGNSSSCNESDGSQITTTITEQLRNDTGLGESINEQSQLNDSNKKDENSSGCTDSENVNSEGQSAKTCSKETEDGENETSNKIRVYLPHLDDEGVYFSDLDDREQRMLSPKVLTTDVFPCIPNKENITIFVDDEIKALLNIEEDEPPSTYTLPVQILPPTPPLVLNILKFHEKLLRRRLLFKLGSEMDLFLQSRSMKRTHCIDMNEQRQYRPIKLFNDSPDLTIESNEHMRCVSTTDCNIISDDEDSEGFLGFTEEEQASKILHRLSRDSGVDADVLLTPNTYKVGGINEDFNKATQLQEQKNADDKNEEVVTNGEKGEEILIEKDAEGDLGPIDNEGANNSTVEETTEASTTMVISNEVETNENCTNKESTETSSTAIIENSINENVAVIEYNNRVNESDIDDTFPDSGLFSQEDVIDLENMQDIEKSKTKIQKWHEYLQPILAKARDRHHFDVFKLGTEIMNELQKPNISTQHIMTSSITFQDVMTNNDESYVSRYFLSTLLLANQNNIKINVNNKCTEKPSNWDDIKLDLLDTKRHTVAIEDNIGIINSKAPSTSGTTIRNKKKSSVINESGCGNGMDENVAVNSEILNVNINVVRPLKQIEKLPNTNDDYDSGIFSNEECMS